MSDARDAPVRIELDPRAGVPVYLQIVRQVERYAGARRLPAGARLPTVRALAVRLGVNVNTVARAYRLLARAGAVAPQPGRGTFVLPASARRRPGKAALQQLVQECIARARRLQFSDAQIAAALRRGLERKPGSLAAGDNHE